MKQDFLSATILLILITDPLGNIPLFVSALARVAPERRLRVILRECAIAFVVLLVFLVFGSSFLDVLRLSDDTLKIAGGVVLFLIAINMIFPGSGGSLVEDSQGGEPLIVPLAIPLIAGPSAMTTVMLLGKSDPARMLEWIGALAIAMSVTTTSFLVSQKLKEVLGVRVLDAVERLMGLVLSAISIEMLLGGLADWVRLLR